jgi:hypothetical protein
MTTSRVQSHVEEPQIEHGVSSKNKAHREDGRWAERQVPETRGAGIFWLYCDKRNQESYTRSLSAARVEHAAYGAFLSKIISRA